MTTNGHPPDFPYGLRPLAADVAARPDLTAFWAEDSVDARGNGNGCAVLNGCRESGTHLHDTTTGAVIPLPAARIVSLYHPSDDTPAAPVAADDRSPKLARVGHPDPCGCWIHQEVAADDTKRRHSDATADVSERPDVPHYTHAAVEHIDILRAVLPPEQFRGFCRGNVLKYLYRLDHKGAALADARKAQDYLRWFVESLEAE